VIAANLAANSTSYSDKGLSASTTYYYRVRAFDGTLASNYTSSASATTPAFGPVPSVVAGPYVSSGLGRKKGTRLNSSHFAVGREDGACESSPDAPPFS
jgi:hypothetical protein